MKYTLTILFFFIAINLFCQASKSESAYTIPDNVYRYKLDFEIKNVVSIDTALVLSLDIDQYEHLRQELADVEVYDVSGNVTIILYSIVTCQQNKRKADLIRRK